MSLLLLLFFALADHGIIWNKFLSVLSRLLSCIIASKTNAHQIGPAGLGQLRRDLYRPSTRELRAIDASNAVYLQLTT